MSIIPIASEAIWAGSEGKLSIVQQLKEMLWRLQFMTGTAALCLHKREVVALMTKGHKAGAGQVMFRSHLSSLTNVLLPPNIKDSTKAPCAAASTCFEHFLPTPPGRPLWAWSCWQICCSRRSLPVARRLPTCKVHHPRAWRRTSCQRTRSPYSSAAARSGTFPGTQVCECAHVHVFVPVFLCVCPASLRRDVGHSPGAWHTLRAIGLHWARHPGLPLRLRLKRHAQKRMRQTEEPSP